VFATVAGFWSVPVRVYQVFGAFEPVCRSTSAGASHHVLVVPQTVHFGEHTSGFGAAGEPRVCFCLLDLVCHFLVRSSTVRLCPSFFTERPSRLPADCRIVEDMSHCLIIVHTPDGLSMMLVVPAAHHAGHRHRRHASSSSSAARADADPSATRCVRPVRSAPLRAFAPEAAPVTRETIVVRREARACEHSPR